MWETIRNCVAEKFASDGSIQFIHVDKTHYLMDQQQVAIGFYQGQKRDMFAKLLFTTYQSRSRLQPNDAKRLTAGQPFSLSFLQTSSRRGFNITALLEAYSNEGKKLDAWGLRQFSIGHAVMKKLFASRPVPPPMLSVVLRNLVHGRNEMFSTTDSIVMYASASLGLTVNY